MSAGLKFNAIVLAGQRPGGSPLTAAGGVAASVLIPVAGRTCIERVCDALRASRFIDQVILCGPEQSIIAHEPTFQSLLGDPRLRWHPPAAGPAASAVSALAELKEPILLTTGDHALLTTAVIDDFCARALDCTADVVAGLVPHALVAARFPESRRTVLRFANGAYCGSNLYALLTRTGERALNFWRQVESDRKRPWRIARHLGLRVLARYVTGRLSIEQAMKTVSLRAGCTVSFLPVPDCHAAIDVDSVADWRLAEQILRDRN